VAGRRNTASNPSNRNTSSEMKIRQSIGSANWCFSLNDKAVGFHNGDGSNTFAIARPASEIVDFQPSKRSTIMLQEAIQQFTIDRDAAKLTARVAQHFQIKKIAPEVVSYLCGEVDLKGFYTIQSFSQCCDEQYSYQKLFHEYGEGLFPALNFGGDGLGVEFWLVLETGQVITLHHDATFYEVAGDISASSGAAFTKEFAKQGSLFSLTQLLQLQASTKDLDEGDPDFERELFVAAAQALGKTYSAIAKISDDSRLEFVRAHCGEFIEENGIENLIDAEKKLQKLDAAATKGKPVKRLDLSYCYLRNIPAELPQLENVEELDLSGNPWDAGTSFAPIAARKLWLADCGLQKLPSLHPQIQALVLSNNPLESLDGLEVYSELRQVYLRQVELPKASIQTLQRALPQCKLTLADAIERLDTELSLWYSSAKKMPAEISTYVCLEKANLKGNENLDLQDAFKKLAASAHSLKHILTDSETTTLPGEIVQFQQLEELELHGHRIFDFAAVEKAYALLAQLPRLKHVPMLSSYDATSRDTQYPEIFLRYLPQFPQIERLEIPRTFFLHPHLLDRLLEVIQDFQQLKSLTILFGIPEGGDVTKGKFHFLKDRIKEVVVTPAYGNIPPAGLFELSGLESLEIREEGFGKSFSFAAFPKLKKLVLAVKRERAFVWQGLEHLQTLEELVIPDLPSETKLPEELAKMTGLKRLSIASEYGLEELPDIFGEMRNLKRLKLGGKFRFDSIPPSFSNLASLAYLEIDAHHKFNYGDREQHKRFDNFPAAITDLTQLHTLILKTGVVPELPEDFSNLSNLRTLNWRMTYGDDGHFPKGKTLAAPQNPANFKHLREIDLTCRARELEFELAGWYEAFLQMPVLESLRMMVNNVSPVPPLPSHFGNHPSLKSADFYLSHHVYTKGNPHDMQPDNFLAVLSQLPSLERLDVHSGYHLKTVPLALANFKQITSLKLDIDDLSPEDVSKTLEIVAALPELRKLSLEAEELPKEIALLTQIESLELSTLPDFPDALMEMQGLKVLHCDFECKAARMKQLEKALPNCVINRGEL
jgi:Leucine-rich repeat (LRR) protein